VSRIVAAREQLACEKYADLFVPKRDNPKTRQMCVGCYKRIDCAIVAMAFVNSGGHPVGIWSGVFLPDDHRVSDDGPPVTGQREAVYLRRLQAIEQLRKIANGEQVVS
jgi:hypothetical protein